MVNKNHKKFVFQMRHYEPFETDSPPENERMVDILLISTFGGFICLQFPVCARAVGKRINGFGLKSHFSKGNTDEVVYNFLSRSRQLKSLPSSS